MFHIAWFAVLVGLLGTAARLQAQTEPPEPPPIPRTLTLTDYQNLVNAATPTAINPAIASAPPGTDWLASVTVATVATAVQDSSPPTVMYVNGPRTEARDPAETKVIKIDRSRGRVRYLNQARVFYWSAGLYTAVSDAVASSHVTGIMDTLGIPTAERAAP
jgi:hypothetical protein